MIERRSFFPRSGRTLSLVAAAVMSWAACAEGVILFRTGDPSANTTQPTGTLADSGWQYQGRFGNFLGTPIAPHFFITAKHIGGAPQFFFRGVTYTVVNSYTDSASDFAIHEVAETFPDYAPLYTRNDEVGRNLVVFGRGTQRGPERVVEGQVRGWEWGASDMLQRWGENRVASVVSGGTLLYALFDQNGLANEAHLSAGDSGGGVFINDNGTWKLAGTNFDVDSFSSGPDGGGPYNAAMFDERGSYTANGTLVTGNAPVPSGFYVTRVSQRIGWITGIIAPRLVNLSSRSVVGTGDQVAIAGFIIQGTAGQSKRVMIRGLGPSLSVNGVPVPGRLSDPFLELYNASGTLIYAVDNWMDFQATEIQNSGLAPSDPREAAALLTLPPAKFTAILRGANGGTGIGLVEVYDLDTTLNSRVGNLSTRAFVGTSDQVLIGGMIVRSVGKRLLWRALGPELAGRGVNGVLMDPTLELHDSNGALLASNDNWQQAPNAAEINATGLAPTDARESAILSISEPGTFTAIVRGAGNTTGIALLEAYLLD